MLLQPRLYSRPCTPHGIEPTRELRLRVVHRTFHRDPDDWRSGGPVVGGPAPQPQKKASPIETDSEAAIRAETHRVHEAFVLQDIV